MKPLREHIYDAIAMTPRTATSVANVLWHNLPEAQTISNFFVSPLTSSQYLEHFKAHQWYYLTMPHEDFTSALTLSGCDNS